MQIVAMNHPITKKLEKNKPEVFTEGNINGKIKTVLKKKEIVRCVQRS